MLPVGIILQSYKGHTCSCLPSIPDIKPKKKSLMVASGTAAQTAKVLYDCSSHSEVDLYLGADSYSEVGLYLYFRVSLHS